MKPQGVCPCPRYGKNWSNVSVASFSHQFRRSALEIPPSLNTNFKFGFNFEIENKINLQVLWTWTLMRIQHLNNLATLPIKAYSELLIESLKPTRGLSLEACLYDHESM